MNRPKLHHLRAPEDTYQNHLSTVNKTTLLHYNVSLERFVTFTEAIINKLFEKSEKF